MYTKHMIDPTDAKTLTRQLAKIAKIQEGLDEAIAERDDLVRAMLTKGAGPTELGDLLGVTRARIYQIRDRRR